MASKKKAYVATNINEKFIMRLGVLEAEIICKCGHKTTRANCEMRPSFFDDITYHNFYCDSCGNFLRCDSAFTPLPAKQTSLEGDSVDDNE